jgi:hypothetical protein
LTRTGSQKAFDDTAKRCYGRDRSRTPRGFLSVGERAGISAVRPLVPALGLFSTDRPLSDRKEIPLSEERPPTITVEEKEIQLPDGVVCDDVVDVWVVADRWWTDNPTRSIWISIKDGRAFCKHEEGDWVPCAL